ncbi:hypothetical protein P3T42_006101 [Paraburkholderia sp. GAS38]|jgi:hypothetical protein
MPLAPENALLGSVQSVDYCIFKENLFVTLRFLRRGFVDILSPAIEPIVPDRETHAELRSITMKRAITVLIASVALFAAVSGVADAAAPAKCNGPASYCNVFFGQ